VPKLGSVKTDWYLDFFSGPFVRLWDAVVPAESTLAEVEFVLGRFKLPPGARILDCPCGAGRHAIPIAKQGFQVTGVDNSSEFLDLARQRGEGLPLELHQADMAVWRSDHAFDGAYCLGNSFGYFPHQTTVDWFAQLHAMLRPGAKFIFETSNLAEIVFTEMHDRGWYEAGGVIMLIQNHYEPWDAVLRTEFRFIENGQETRQETLQHIYTAGELRRMLEAAGFRVLELLRDLKGTEFSFGGPRLYLIAERN
jgi:cyclopropane fatty-acyl-phospholipid synthase-like methyltransferase